MIDEITPEEDARFRVAFTPTLRDLVRAGARHNYNRQLAWEEIEKVIDPEGAHLFEQIILHNDDHWRCWLLMKFIGDNEPHRVIMDMSMEDWERLITPRQLKALANAVRSN